MIFTTLQVIERALLLFEKPGRWIQGTNARTADGRPCHWGAPEARKFDLEGGLRRAGGEAQQKHWRTLSEMIRDRTYPHRNLFDWNDEPGRTQQDVVQLLKGLAAAFRYHKEEDAA